MYNKLLWVLGIVALLYVGIAIRGNMARSERCEALGGFWVKAHGRSVCISKAVLIEVDK